MAVTCVTRHTRVGCNPRLLQSDAAAAAADKADEDEGRDQLYQRAAVEP